MASVFPRPIQLKQIAVSSLKLLLPVCSRIPFQRQTCTTLAAGSGTSNISLLPVLCQSSRPFPVVTKSQTLWSEPLWRCHYSNRSFATYAHENQCNLLKSRCDSMVYQPKRTVTRYSYRKCKKKTVPGIPKRFYRMANGLWLRAVVGRNRKMWKKTNERKNRNKKLIFCNKTQSKKLDLMVTNFWKKRRYYPYCPYEPLQERNYAGFKQYPGKGVINSLQPKFREKDTMPETQLMDKRWLKPGFGKFRFQYKPQNASSTS